MLGRDRTTSVPSIQDTMTFLIMHVNYPFSLWATLWKSHTLDKYHRISGLALSLSTSVLTVEAQVQWATSTPLAHSNVDAALDEGKTVWPIVTCSAWLWAGQTAKPLYEMCIK